jgi:3-methyladenine DNA glycosylase AlkD
MTLDAVMRHIEARGTRGAAAVYRRHGVAEPTVGMSYADVGALARRIGTDHQLALLLWKTGVHDARIVATKVADPARLAPSALRSWLKACANYVITDAVAALAADTPTALAAALEWIEDPGEWVASAGWTTIAVLAMREGVPAAVAARLVAAIERGIHAAPNRTRHAMNSALIAIGGAMPSLQARALAAAAAIGPVTVDHGATGCKTPDAAATIAKMATYRAGKAGKAAKTVKTAKSDKAAKNGKAAKGGTAATSPGQRPRRRLA